MSFYKFPRTPHLFVMPGLDIRDDKVMSDNERLDFLLGPVVVEEKIDGANVGISIDIDTKEVRFQNRGNYLSRGGEPQFVKLWDWVFSKTGDFQEVLLDRYILFGEWCYAVHSVHYRKLPDWFLGFDIYDKQNDVFLPLSKRDKLFKTLNVLPVPFLGRRKYTVGELKELVKATSSGLGADRFEGVYLRRENENMLLGRGKIVRSGFVQEIDGHWSKKKMVNNELKNNVL